VGTGNSQTWTKLEGTLTVPSCELASLIVYVEGPAQGVSFYVDDASLFREYLVPSQGSQTLSGNFVLQSDWGSGYCVDLVVTNAQAQATIDWSASFNLNGTVISGVWNLGLAQSGAMATVTPLDAWSRQIAAGQSSHSLGFCAARPSGGNALPSSLSVLGAF
jgi:cellulase/cellobiase CelA1